MSKELVVFTHPQVPDKWSYKDSVSKCKQLIYKWKNITEELANELWVAREKLATTAEAQGRPAEGGTKVPRYSWSDYCREIGHTRQVVNRWIDRWYEYHEDLKRLEVDVADKDLPAVILPFFSRPGLLLPTLKTSA